MNRIYLFKELINGSNDNRQWEAYIIQQIIVPVCKMLIDKFFCSKRFLAEATTPFVHIIMDLMLLLFPKHVIFRMKPAFAWEFIFLLFHKGHQVLHKERVLKLQCQYGCINAVSNHIACPTSSTAFQAARLLSLEQCTSCVCDFVWWRILISNENTQLFSIVSQDST